MRRYRLNEAPDRLSQAQWFALATYATGSVALRDAEEALRVVPNAPPATRAAVSAPAFYKKPAGGIEIVFFTPVAGSKSAIERVEVEVEPDGGALVWRKAP